MKTRKAWRYTMTYQPGENTQRWWGNCPRWASWAPEGAVVSRERVLTLGATPQPCTYPDCSDLHVPVPCPF